MAEGMGRRSQQAWVITLAAAFGLLVISAAVFTLGNTISRLTDGADNLHALDETLRLGTVSRAQLGLAVHLDALERSYNADVRAARQRSFDESTAATTQIEALLDVGGLESYPYLERELEVFVAASADALGALNAGDPDTAEQIVTGDLSDSFDRFADEAVADRRDVLQRINSADQTSARLADIARILLVLIIPAGLVIIYREINIRQFRAKELEIRLDAERDLATARDEFVANASHELRTPLTAIYGLGQILMEEPDVPESALEMIDMINSEAADLSRMVEDLLTTARLAAGQLRFEPEEVDVADETTTIIQPFATAGFVVETDVASGIVYADRLRQRQVVRNLISNATKYGGPRLRLVGEQAGAFYRWTVQDNGEGVPPELEERLFQRFIHTMTFQQAVAGGVGLGLSIVKSLAEGMGGSVNYKREDGWTKFIVEIPLMSGPPSEPYAEPASLPA